MKAQSDGAECPFCQEDPGGCVECGRTGKCEYCRGQGTDGSCGYCNDGTCMNCGGAGICPDCAGEGVVRGHD